MEHHQGRLPGGGNLWPELESISGGGLSGGLSFGWGQLVPQGCGMLSIKIKGGEESQAKFYRGYRQGWMSS